MFCSAYRKECFTTCLFSVTYRLLYSSISGLTVSCHQSIHQYLLTTKICETLLWSMDSNTWFFFFLHFCFASLSGAVVMSYGEPGRNYSSQQLITQRLTHRRKYSLMGCPSARLFAPDSANCCFLCNFSCAIKAKISPHCHAFSCGVHM